MTPLHKCTACDGTGGSGEFIENYAPPSWDDPGWYEVEEAPCPHCRGTGMVPEPAAPSTGPIKFTVELDEEIPF